MENQYLDLLNEVLNKGSRKGDRTGVGVTSLFGAQMRHDLSESFPLLTTKKIHFKSVVHELLWMLSGDTNIGYLRDNKVRIWDEWADSNGDLGPIYPSMWAHWPAMEGDNIIVSYQKYLGDCSNEIEDDSTEEDKSSKVYSLWKSISEVGGKVSNEWSTFSEFKRTLSLVPGYNFWLSNPYKYVLTKSYYGPEVYSLETSKFTTEEINDDILNGTPIKVVYKGNEFKFLSPREASESLKVDSSTILVCLKYLRTIDDLTVTKLELEEGELFRPKLYIDQIAEVVETLKTNPNSRRMIVSAWNPSVLPDNKLSFEENVSNNKAALPPCHSFFQFYVSDGKLSCQLYQRSADIFLGVPFNMAFYSLLTLMIAQVVGLEPGDFIHTFGDVHIYDNLLNQVETQLSRSPKDLPQVILNKGVTELKDFTYEDITLEGYEPHPLIRGKVAV